MWLLVCAHGSLLLIFPLAHEIEIIFFDFPMFTDLDGFRSEKDGDRKGRRR